MTELEFVWGVIGFGTGFSIAAIWNAIAIDLLTKKWMEVTAKNRITMAQSVQDAYEQGLKDTGAAYEAGFQAGQAKGVNT